MGCKNIYIYLDDIRKPNYSILPDNAAVIECQNYAAAVAAIENTYDKSWTNLTIDLDHDLGEDKSGYDFCKYLIEKGITGKFHLHSMNPVGVTNMRQLLTHYGWKEF